MNQFNSIHPGLYLQKEEEGKNVCYIHFFLHVKPQLMSENEMNGVGYLRIRATYLISVSAEQLTGQ